jgi:hypothetical protein
MEITQNKKVMKASTFFLSIGFALCSYALQAQATLSSYAGSWKMTPVNTSHKFSKITISDNENTLTLKFKKSAAKSAIARMNPGTNRMESYIDNKGYYLVLGAQPNTMSLHEIETNTKVGDYIK